MHNPEAHPANHRPLENNERTKPSRPLLPSLHSMASPSHPREASAARPVRMTRTRSSPTTVQYGDEDKEGRDSHELTMSPRAFGRESLVDNLLLSFDKLGTNDLGFDQFYTDFDEYDDEDEASTSSHNSRRMGYGARGRRSNSGGSYQQLGKLPAHSARQLGSIDYGSMPSGFGFSYNRENISRSGPPSSGKLVSLDADEYYYATRIPTIHSSLRERCITIDSPPPSLHRRPSNKSLKSIRKAAELSSPESLAPPPLPAFQTLAPAPATPVKSKPGFFKRVFGGSSSSSTKQVQALESSATAFAASQQQQQQQATTPPPLTTKKSSFFRRRKKSVSESLAQPIQPLSVQNMRDIDPAEPSPVSSLRAVMSPYLRASAKQSRVELDLDKETAHFEYNATIRAVASSNPNSPARPTFFGESRARKDSESQFSINTQSTIKSHPKYLKESRFGKTGAQELLSIKPPRNFGDDRPQTSPNSPHYPPIKDMERNLYLPPPPLRPLSLRRSLDAIALEKEKERGRENEKGRERDQERAREREREVRQENEGDYVFLGESHAEKPKPIATVQDIELAHAREQKQRVSRGTELTTRSNEEQEPLESSWLATSTPLSAATLAGAPTVVLQVQKSKGAIEGDDESETIASDEIIEEEATEHEKELVKKVYEGDEECVSKDRAVAWLGAAGLKGERVRKAYMTMFNWSNMNILSAVRMLCGRLILRGEAQQVDRMVDAIAKRWCECNSNHGFKSLDVIHTILYSLLLLNTDLHMADVPNSQRMTKNQFIKNTMTTIRRALADLPNTAPEARPTHHNTMPIRPQPPSHSDDSSVAGAVACATFPLVYAHKRAGESRRSLDLGRGVRSSSKTSGIGNLSPRLPDDNSVDWDLDGGLSLVNAPLAGTIKAWETQVEIILKDFYTSIKACALPVYGATRDDTTNNHNSLSVISSGMLRRSPSNVSKAPSEHSVNRRNDSCVRLGTKWAAKNRSRPKLYNGSYAGSSKTSLEDRSLWSPSASSTWSKYSLDKTQTTMSVTSLGSAFGYGDYQQSIGFANALSHAIIREEASGTTADEASADLEDDGLELAGAPWAKEGMVKHKHHLEGVDKRAKNRGWTECFAVIEKGTMRLFQFGSTDSGSANIGGVVGGGNWTENAQAIGSFLLRQTIASALPPPGYSKTRPYVWALSLPTGAVHFFQGGTAEIVKEWVSTANYWSARLSKEPLLGGVSNVEYGWGDCIADIDAMSTTATFGPRPSLQESIRSSIDHATMVRPRLPGDKVVIGDWTPPGQSMMASSLSEADQLKALETYVSNIEAELQRHNELRSAMALAFSPRHPNTMKAFSNWEKKSSYLLREIVKFKTYIDSLQAAAIQRERLKQQEGPSFPTEMTS